jgi:hypothetical protein
MRSSIRILLITLPLLTTGCSSLFSVEAETEEICKTQRNVNFPGVPLPPGTVGQTFNYPIGDLLATLPTEGTEARLRMRLFEVTATGGNPELSGVERASVSLHFPDESRPRELLKYTRPSNQASTQKLSAVANDQSSVDINKLLGQDTIELTLEASGQLPPRDWTADVRVCAGLFLKADVLDLIF